VGAAVINQHPGYFKAAILHVGLYDMIRAENFTVGVYHSKGEYGSVNDKRQFQNLLSYSPLHNIRPNTQYPAILVETALNDDRVPPLHSYKYVASLQELTKSTNPILLRIEKNEGHSTQSRDRMINNVGYDYSFLFKELGMKYK
jgi:prolyl oligopeptidase